MILTVASFNLGGQLVNEVTDPRAPFGWEDYATVGKEIEG